MENGNTPSDRPRHKNLLRLLVGVAITILLLSIGYLVWRISHPSSLPQAPEAERVLEAQTEMPFQVLIPAYLPGSFNRQRMKIYADKFGPQGEPMVQLVYPTRRGGAIAIYEWIPNPPVSDGQPLLCNCVCRSPTECSSIEMGVNVGTLRVMINVTAPDVLSSEEFLFVLDTLGPAVNSQIFDKLEDVPVTYALPQAEQVPINAEGVQEITLVVTPEGYSPQHFAVRKNIPVRLIFRQLGQVGCGIELIFAWDEGKSTTLRLVSPADKQVFEFTPTQSGDYRFNCPHLIYRGVMTVVE